MDPRIQAGIIAFCAAIIATGITGFINYKIELWKNKKAKSDELKALKNTKKEELIKNLYILESKLSISKIDMHSDVSTIQVFNQNYDEVNILIAETLMLISLYFPKYKAEFKPIREKSSIFWKSYKDYLTTPKTSATVDSPYLQKAITCSTECISITTGINNQL